MMKYWHKKNHEEIKTRVFNALKDNINYDEQQVLGIPASYLDDKVFNQDDSFLQNAPFISTLIQNPNHIGCHTLGSSESYFKGTQEIERDLMKICAVDILKNNEEAYDGYVASGGTEANIQAIWIYRNYYMSEKEANTDQICILCSDDSHYSMHKAGNLLGLDVYRIPVEFETRSIERSAINDTIQQAVSDGKQYFIVISNMMTTMFGSVDDVDTLIDVLHQNKCHYKLHIDGAYGGFYYPFTSTESSLTFQNEHISSFTLDAHKMAQAPYGTGIFIIRKGLIHHVNTAEASYVKGEDITLIGSRSGANAVATWMILTRNGPYGWTEKIFILQKRTDWMCRQLEELNIGFYRHSQSNIITIKAASIDSDIANDFGLVPDRHDNPSWYKIVLMEHVTIEKLILLIDAIKRTL